MSSEPRSSREPTPEGETPNVRGLSPADDPCPLPPPFPVVGLGGSAGSLEPITTLLEGLPPRPGAAFVVIQHLPKDHPGLLAEILSRHAPIPAVEVAEATAMEPDQIYVAPPDHDLVIEEGRIVPQAREERSLHHPFDRFLTSLARACGERAVAVVFSGSGTDGTAGARDVRIQGGVVLVQEPDSAVHSSMPRSVLAARAADYVLAPEKAHRVLLRYIDSLRHEIESPDRVDRRLEPYLDSILAALHARAGHDFREYKRSTVERRVLRRMSLAGVDSPAQYVRFLARELTEAEVLRRDLLIGVSTFFRDAEAWDVLVREALPDLASGQESPLRAWVAGCSTGEEAYSLAICLAEALDAAGRPLLDFQLFATDVDPDALETARAGLYPREIESRVSARRLARFFTPERDGYRVRDELRSAVTFARHDLLSNPPLLGIHLISCRNVLIYLEPEVQERLVKRFHTGLVRGGILFLGKAEGPRAGSDLFDAVSQRWRIYRRDGGPGDSRSLSADLSMRAAWTRHLPTGLVPEGRSRWAELTEGLLLHHHAPVAALVDRRYQVLYLSGATDRYLAQPSGRLTRNLLEMAREGLQRKLRTAVRSAIEGGEAAAVHARVSGDGSGRRVRLTATPVHIGSGEPDLLLVTFEDVGVAPAVLKRSADEEGALEADVRHLEEELRRTQEELQSTIEELETSNEEVLSVNEELQTANEELEASKEELETLNQELAFANAELQETNHSLRRSEEMLRRVTDALPVLISYVDADGYFRMVNATYEAWFGRSRAEIEGCSVEEILGHDAWLKVGPDLERALGGDGHEFEGELELPLGTRYVSVVRIPHRDDTGSVRGVFNLVTDLTEREAARREQARLAAIVRSSSDAILSKDLDGIITSWNRGAEEIFGYSADEAMGSSITIICPEDRKHEPFDIIETIRRGEEVRQLETVRVRKDGSLVDISVTVSPIYGDDGTVIGASTIDRDITFRRRAEVALQKSEERYREQAHALAEADRRKDEFLAMLGHELRNPLSPIRHALEILRESDADLDPAERKRYLEVMSRQLGQLTRLVDDLLDVARITQGRVRIERRPVLLREVLERAVETAKPLLEERGHRFSLELPEGEVLLEADPDRLAQAVGNLLHNAGKFTPAGGTIALRAAREDRWIAVRVRDSGPGVPEELLPRLFELFSQGAQPLDRSQGGLGLGLALVRQLVEMHGGTAAASNLPEGGAEIVLRLPELDGEPAAAAQPAAAAGSAHQPSRRVLVVDDNQDSVEALSALLELRGHRVATAGSGRQALERAEELRPEVVILDIGLPEMDGFEVARRLRARFGAAPTLVALTGYGRDGDRARGREAGFDHYLLKPVTSRALEILLDPRSDSASDRASGLTPDPAAGRSPDRAEEAGPE